MPPCRMFTNQTSPGCHGFLHWTPAIAEWANFLQGDDQLTNLDPDDFAQQFASENYAGICPDAMSAMEKANAGHATAYGDDAWTAQASNAFRDLFETDCELFFVFNGTAANSLALAALCQSYHGVI